MDETIQLNAEALGKVNAIRDITEELKSFDDVMEVISDARNRD